MINTGQVTILMIKTDKFVPMKKVNKFYMLHMRI